MTRYELTKLVSWADTLHSRKRLQKIVFFLQAAGYPLEADFILHHFGPYSEHVSRLTDELVRLVLLKEGATDNAVGQQYSYQLTEQAREKMQQLEESEQGRLMAEKMVPFEPLVKSLLRVDLKDLEVAATVLYFRQQGLDWPQAMEKACTFKRIPADGPLAGRALVLARSVEESARKPAG
jgi:uncharacterized protein YwgA